MRPAPEDPEDLEGLRNWTLAPYKSAKGRPANGRPANGRTANWQNKLASWQLQDSKEWQSTDWQDGKALQFGRLADFRCALSHSTGALGGTVADICG